MILRPRFFAPPGSRDSTLDEQIHVIVHECTHLFFTTNDYAYAFQPKFASLRGAAALANADTVTLFLMNVMHMSANEDLGISIMNGFMH